LIPEAIKYINKSENKFKDYIRNYSNFLDEKKNVTLFNAGIPKTYWYRHHLPEEYVANLLLYTRKSFEKIL
jgi:hypothetical protein